MAWDDFEFSGTGDEGRARVERGRRRVKEGKCFSFSTWNSRACQKFRAALRANRAGWGGGPVLLFARELPSLYNPYWRPRLTSLSSFDRLQLAVLDGDPAWLAGVPR